MSAANPISNFSSDAADLKRLNCTTDLGVPVGRRAAARLRLAIPARLVSLYGTHRCILIDLSSTGAQLGLEKPLAAKEAGFLQIAGQELFCEIVRTDQGPNGGINGLVFDPPLIEQDVLDMRRFAEHYELDELRGLKSEVKDWVEGTVRARP
ncbi:MAG: PilZ domain-containing protein [Erythrobacter sp.]|uniref:PilZ domain-containing protein n=1 Tax=Erythrobacter sp. TaxID=1042 RepID=UPI00329A35D5